jgi:hypothetical protein
MRLHNPLPAWAAIRPSPDSHNCKGVRFGSKADAALTDAVDRFVPLAEIDSRSGMCDLTHKIGSLGLRWRTSSIGELGKRSGSLRC